jgi:hypothetical protein
VIFVNELVVPVPKTVELVCYDLLKWELPEKSKCSGKYYLPTGSSKTSFTWSNFSHSPKNLLLTPVQAF